MTRSDYERRIDALEQELADVRAELARAVAALEKAIETQKSHRSQILSPN